jgi:hypothetical protein
VPARRVEPLWPSPVAALLLLALTIAGVAVLIASR